MLLEIEGFDTDILGTAAVSLRSSLKYRRNWNKNGPTVKLLRKFMPRTSKGFRAYFPIGAHSPAKNVVVPLQVRLAVKQAGFRITDYLAKKCVKLSDKEQKNVFNIGKVISKDTVAKAAFDNDPQLQNSKSAEFTMVVSCHPYDIIGMSTGRSWDDESCMRLKDFRDGQSDGVNNRYLERDVAEGTLVAYAVRTADTNIEKPLGRCLLKPFVRDDGKEDILYRRETSIYGNPVPGFSDTLQFFLRKLNAGIPAGIYHLNKQLYNDGVGRAVEQEDSGAVTDNGGVDWAVVDREAKLEEHPELAPSYISYLIKRYRDGENPASSVIRQTLELSEKLSNQQCRQIARLISTVPELVKAFLKTIKIADEGSQFAPRLLKSKDLREAIEKQRESLTWIKSSQTATLFSKKDAHNYFEQMEKDTNKYWDVAYNLLAGNMAMSVKDIESIPELHRIVYFVATLNREASAFDYDVNQETAHGLLSVMTPVAIKLDDADVRQFKQFLRYYEEYRVPAAAHVLALLKNGEDETANTIAMSITDPGFTDVMRSRKFSRRFLAHKNPPKGIALLIMSAVAELIDDHAGNDAGVAREILSQISRMNSIDALMSKTYYKILRSAPNLYSKLFFSDIRVGNTLINETIRVLPAVEQAQSIASHAYDDYQRDLKRGLDAVPAPETLTPINDEQRQLWDLQSSLLHMSGHTITRIVTDYDPYAWADRIAANISEIRGLDDLQIDLQKFPQLLNADTASMLNPVQFIGDDNGVTMMDQAAKLGLYALTDIVAGVFSKDSLEVVRSLFLKRNGGSHMLMREVSDMYREGNIEKLQDMYNFAYSYVQKVDRFLDRFVPADGQTILEKLSDALDLPVEQLQEDAPAILSLMSQFKTIRTDTPSVLRMFEVMLPPDAIVYGPEPSYRLPKT